MQAVERHAEISLAISQGGGEDGLRSVMRRSGAVPLTLLTTVALATASGCDDRQREVRNCVDAENHIVRDSRCNPSPSSGGSGGGGYHYVYGGASGESIGDTVEGGSSEPEAGAMVVSGESGDVVRGGFGSSESGAHGGRRGVAGFSARTSSRDDTWSDRWRRTRARGRMRGRDYDRAMVDADHFGLILLTFAPRMQN